MEEVESILSIPTSVAEVARPIDIAGREKHNAIAIASEVLVIAIIHSIRRSMANGIQRVSGDIVDASVEVCPDVYPMDMADRFTVSCAVSICRIRIDSTRTISSDEKVSKGRQIGTQLIELASAHPGPRDVVNGDVGKR